MKKITLPILSSFFYLAITSCTSTQTENEASRKQSDFISSYSKIVYKTYSETPAKADLLKTAIENLTNQPTQENLSLAKEAG